MRNSQVGIEHLAKYAQAQHDAGQGSDDHRNDSSSNQGPIDIDAE